MDKNPALQLADELEAGLERRIDRNVRIAQLFNQLRNSAPIGAIGIVEFRNLLANLFPEFAEVRDNELDSFLTDYVSDLMSAKPRRSPEQEWESDGSHIEQE